MKTKETKKKLNKKAALYIIVAVLLMMILILFSYKLISNGKKLSDKEISTVLENFPYESILDVKNKTTENLTNEQILYIGLLGLEDYQIISKPATEGCFDKYDEISAKCEARELGLSEKKSSKLDTNLWKNISNYSSYSMFSLDSLKTVVKNKLNLDLNYSESFYNEITLPECGTKPVIYDKNVNMLFTTEGLGCTVGTHHSTYITSGYKDNDIYEIYLVEGTFDFNIKNDNGYFVLTNRANEKILDNINIDDLDNEYEESLLKKYINTLDHYKLTFKKVGDNYQFVSVNYLG